MAQISDLKAFINTPGTFKVLSSAYLDGTPHTALKQSLRLTDDGKLEYVEYFESSNSYRNVTAAIWFDQKVSVLVTDGKDRGYAILGKVESIEVSGSRFEEAYRQAAAQGYDIAAIVTIAPETVEIQSLAVKSHEQALTHPFFKHLDQIAVED